MERYKILSPFPYSGANSPELTKDVCGCTLLYQTSAALLEEIVDSEEPNAPSTVVDIEDAEVGDFEIVRMITKCFGRYENEDMAGADVEARDICDDNDVEDVAALFDKSKTPLYAGSNSNRLAATLLLLNCFATFAVSNACADEVFKLIHELLPTGNRLPKTHYEARKYLSRMGLSFHSIHSCRNGCCLFRKELKDADRCPKCEQSRYVTPRSKRPMKVLRYFPIIPSLKRMFRCSRLAELCKWHGVRRNHTGKVECVPDSKAWKHIETLDPEFTAEDRNIRMGLTLDGINPFSNQSLSHSTWPVVLLNYNLPPWLVTKRFFLTLALIILSQESITSENIDVYLAPLIEDLLQLWEGVTATDVSAANDSRNFTLCAMLLWCIHDFPAYGLLSGQVIKGYKGCPECGPHVTTRQSTSLGKNVYLGHRRYLARNHPYCRMKRAFDGSEKLRPAPRPLKREDILDFSRRREAWLRASSQNPPARDQDPVHETGVKRLSALFALPYWKISITTALD
jgi:hypothetical protein